MLQLHVSYFSIISPVQNCSLGLFAVKWTLWTFRFWLWWWTITSRFGVNTSSSLWALFQAEKVSCVFIYSAKQWSCHPTCLLCVKIQYMCLSGVCTYVVYEIVLKLRHPCITRHVAMFHRPHPSKSWFTILSRCPVQFCPECLVPQKQWNAKEWWYFVHANNIVCVEYHDVSCSRLLAHIGTPQYLTNAILRTCACCWTLHTRRALLFFFAVV